MFLFRIRLLKRPSGLAKKPTVLQFRSHSFSGAPKNHELTATSSNSLPFNSRWFSDLQARCEKLKGKQYPPECVQRAEQLSAYAEANWLELLAGRQGFLIGREWRGLDNHQLFWGDMVSSYPNSVTSLCL